jgi:hypothetical protein
MASGRGMQVLPGPDPYSEVVGKPGVGWLGYRIARGEAARLAEMATFGHGWGRDFAAGIGGMPTRSSRR